MHCIAAVVRAGGQQLHVLGGVSYVVLFCSLAYPRLVVEVLFGPFGQAGSLQIRYPYPRQNVFGFDLILLAMPSIYSPSKSYALFVDGTF